MMYIGLKMCHGLRHALRQLPIKLDINETLLGAALLVSCLVGVGLVLQGITGIRGCNQHTAAKARRHLSRARKCLKFFVILYLIKVFVEVGLISDIGDSLEDQLDNAVGLIEEHNRLYDDPHIVLLYANGTNMFARKTTSCLPPYPHGYPWVNNPASPLPNLFPSHEEPAFDQPQPISTPSASRPYKPDFDQQKPVSMPKPVSRPNRTVPMPMPGPQEPVFNRPEPNNMSIPAYERPSVHPVRPQPHLGNASANLNIAKPIPMPMPLPVDLPIPEPVPEPADFEINETEAEDDSSEEENDFPDGVEAMPVPPLNDSQSERALWKDHDGKRKNKRHRKHHKKLSKKHRGWGQLDFDQPIYVCPQENTVVVQVDMVRGHVKEMLLSMYVIATVFNLIALSLLCGCIMCCNRKYKEACEAVQQVPDHVAPQRDRQSEASSEMEMAPVQDQSV